MKQLSFFQKINDDNNCAKQVNRWKRYNDGSILNNFKMYAKRHFLENWVEAKMDCGAYVQGNIVRNVSCILYPMVSSLF
jgi:hypothetical protein